MHARNILRLKYNMYNKITLNKTTIYSTVPKQNNMVATIFEDRFPAFFLKIECFSSYFFMKKIPFSSFDVKIAYKIHPY